MASFRQSGWYEVGVRAWRRWRPWAILVLGLAVSAGALAGFVSIAEGVVERELDSLDRTLLLLVQWIRAPGTTQLMVALTTLGDAVPLAVATAFWMVVSAARREPCAAALVAVTAGGATVLNLLLKMLFARARPPESPVAIGDYGAPALGYAFPSGHAMLSLCIYGFAAYLALRGGWRRPARLGIAAGHVALILGIGFSRLYLGVHWPTDVAAGYLAGATWLAACILACALGCGTPSRPIARP